MIIKNGFKRSDIGPGVNQSEHGIGVPFSIGRDRRTTRIREVQKGIYRVEASGRIVIDGPYALRGAFYNSDNFWLEND